MLTLHSHHADDTEDVPFYTRHKVWDCVSPTRRANKSTPISPGGRWFPEPFIGLQSRPKSRWCVLTGGQSLVWPRTPKASPWPRLTHGGETSPSRAPISARRLGGCAGIRSCRDCLERTAAIAGESGARWPGRPRTSPKTNP
jgi:hypothetical protein